MNRQAGSPPPTNDVIFPTLTESIRARRCVAVIGAGVSAADYPIWAHLISHLQERCGVRAEDFPSASALDVAQAALDKNPAAYYQALDEIFDRRPAPRSSRRYHLLARIQFLSYLTLNLDPLLVDTPDLHRNITVSDFPHLQSQHCYIGPDGRAYSNSRRFCPSGSPFVGLYMHPKKGLVREQTRGVGRR